MDITDNSPSSLLPSLFRKRIACKCCGGNSDICAVVDFSRCGIDVMTGRKVDAYAGVPVYFYCCTGCGFTFTPLCDEWTGEMFAAYIYNDDYARHDPYYLDERPRENAALISQNFPEMANTAILDYGSGLGLLEARMRESGFSDMVSFDPYTTPSRPETQFDTILAFEVFEHHPDPRALMADINSLLKPNGAVLFSTLFINEAVHAVGLENWSYCVPRNGHISFFTPESISLLASEYGLTLGSFNRPGWNVLYRDARPDWVGRYF